MYATLKAKGNRYQRTMLDRYALARTQTRQLGDGLAALLSRLPLDPTTPNTPNDQPLAAIALFKLKVAPAVTVHLPFGGDNHNDADLADELEQTVASISSLEFLWSELTGAGLQDRVMFASFNTFGRTLKRNSRGGRDHNGGHHVMLLFGQKIRGSVVGGIAPEGNDFMASAFDAASGAVSETGEVRPVETRGPGNALLASIESDHCTKLVVGFGERGVPAERIAASGADEVRRYLTAEVPACEQLVASTLGSV